MNMIIGMSMSMIMSMGVPYGHECEYV